jgi:hypothetical protein
MSVQSIRSTLPGSLAPARRTQRSRFFLGISLTLLLIVLVGFTPTLYLRPLFHVQPKPAYLYLHGIILTAWFVWLPLQASLIAMRRVDLHRRLGIAGAVIAAGVVAGALAAQLGKAHRLKLLGMNLVARLPIDAAIFWQNLATLFVFATFVSLAIAMRSRPEVHKRLLILASINMLGPVFGRISRWPLLGGHGLDLTGPMELVLARYAIVGLAVALIVHDLARRRRVHPATWIGIVSIVLTRIAATTIAASAVGRSVVRSFS